MKIVNVILPFLLLSSSIALPMEGDKREMKKRKVEISAHLIIPQSMQSREDLFDINSNDESMVSLPISASKAEQSITPQVIELSRILFALYQNDSSVKIDICVPISEKHPIIDYRDENGQTALHMAVLSNNLTLIDDLYDHHANPNITDNIGRTPLHHAAVCGYTSIANYLLKYFLADKTIKDVFNKTAYDLAVANKYTKTANIIKKQ